MNYDVLAVFCFIGLETISGKTIEYIVHCHLNLILYGLLTTPNNKNKSGFIRSQTLIGSHLKGDHEGAHRGHI